MCLLLQSERVDLYKVTTHIACMVYNKWLLLVWTKKDLIRVESVTVHDDFQKGATFVIYSVAHLNMVVHL